MRLLATLMLAAAIGFGAVYGISHPASRAFAASAFGPMVAAECVIKGNVSINSRKRIYHVPGQHYYDDTVISPEFGERWFCSEAEARAAGWRRAGY